MTTWVAGFDGGKSGALALVTVQGGGGLSLFGLWCWVLVSRSSQAAWRLALVPSDPALPVRERVRPTLGHVGEDIANGLRDATRSTGIRLYGEDTHVKFPKAALSIAGSSGRVLGPIERYAKGQAARMVRSTVWRADLLRMGHWTGRGAAKKAAAEFVPGLVPGLAVAIGRLDREVEGYDPEHAYDAAGVAAWGARDEAER